MSAGDTLQGKRVRNVQALYDGEPGDYVMVDSDEPERRSLWFRDPTGHIGHVVKHDITEHDDGTVTVSPSILATISEHGHDWHGYLECGVWREV